MLGEWTWALFMMLRSLPWWWWVHFRRWIVICRFGSAEQVLYSTGESNLQDFIVQMEWILYIREQGPRAVDCMLALRSKGEVYYSSKARGSDLDRCQVLAI